MLLDKKGVKEVLAILLQWVEKEGNKTIAEFIAGWNENNSKKISRI